jgi:hypothetical protein
VRGQQRYITDIAPSSHKSFFRIRLHHLRLHATATLAAKTAAALRAKSAAALRAKSAAALRTKSAAARRAKSAAETEAETEAEAEADAVKSKKSILREQR